MKRLMLAATALLGLARPVLAADLHATTADYWAALAKTSRPGDVVWLASGTYPDPRLYNAGRAAPGVVVKPEPGAKVVFSALSVSTSNGFTFDGIEVNGPVAFANSSHGGIRNSLIRGIGESFPTGIMLRNGADLVATGNELTHVSVGIAVYDNRVGGITVSGNNIHEIAGPDAIDVFSSVNVTLDGNTIRDIASADGSHPDALQVDSPVAGGARTAHITITRNSYRRGTSGVTIGGVFKPSLAAQGIPFVGHADDLTVRGNLNFGTLYNAQSFSDVHGAVVENNFNQGYAPYPANVVVRGGSSNVVIRNVVANNIGPYVPRGDPPLANVQMRDNSVIPAASGPGDVKRLSAWLSNSPN